MTSMIPPRRLHPLLFGLVTCALLAAPTGRAAIVLHETFPTDGAVTSVSPRWVTHSGTAGQADVGGGALVLTQSESEDVNALLEGQPYAVDAAGVLYARFTIRFTELPQGAGGYFAHFKDAANGFRGRLFATTTGAAAGSLRLGVSAGGGTPSATVAGDLALETDATVVLRYEVAAGSTRLWLNPTAEADPSVDSTDTASAVPITSFAFRQSLSSGAGMGTLRVDNLVVATTFAEALAGPAAGTAPSITTPPASIAVTRGSPATLSVVASGSEPLGYQWFLGGQAVSGGTGATLSFAAVADTDAGVYTVTVTNTFGSATAGPATLTVNAPAGPTTVKILELRRTVDPATFAPTDTTNLFRAEGVVVTHTNVTTAANALFYIQDDTAGIAVFVSGGASIRPAAGDKVAVVGPLGAFNGLLQFNLTAANPTHSVSVLATGLLLPEPRLLDLSLQSDPTAMFDLIGSRIQIANVALDLTQPNFPTSTSGGNVTLTDPDGQTFTLRIDGRVTEILGQPKPKTNVDVVGVLSIFDSSVPYTSGYQILPTRLADVLGAVAAPRISFTNTVELLVAGDAPVHSFNEIALRPGESLTLRAVAVSPDGFALRLSAPSEGLPAGAAWTIPVVEGPSLEAVFTWTPTAADLGRRVVVRLVATGTQAANEAEWIVYVPTAEEDSIVITEFSANAPGANDTPYGNILNRAETPPAPNSDDEFVELTNTGATAVNLRNWSISDAAQVRHRFYNAFELPANTASVIYGGPLNGFEPQVNGPVLPASENAFGFGLNNSGGDSILLRNAAGNLVSRVVYSVVPTNATLTRFPHPTSGFVPHRAISTTAASPGRRFDGKSTSDTLPASVSRLPVSAARLPSGAVRLTWPGEPDYTYTVHASDSAAAPFSVLATGVGPGSGTTEYIDTQAATGTARFYRITIP